jgi:hypothetical protein
VDVTAEGMVGEVVGESLGTGNGTQKVFGPTVNTPILAKTELVRLNGVVQSPGTYTMDYEAGTVTFTTAPATGKAVTIDYSTSAFGVDCYHSETTFSEPPVRVASGATVTVTAAETWRSQDNLAQYKALAAVNLGIDLTTVMTDTYTSGTADFFTLSNAWSLDELMVLKPPFAAQSTTSYTVAVVGQEDIGSFLDCYKVEYSVAGSVKKTEWWSPTVLAFVKQVTTGTYALPETQVLASYSLA